MPSRLEATVCHRQHLEVEQALDWLARVNAGQSRHPEALALAPVDA